jgi:transposase
VLKVQLYEIIKAYKPKYKTFLVDEIMTANGYTVLRLPPYHPERSPIELIWADVKQWVGAEKGQMTLNIFASRDSKKLEKTSGLVFVNL